MKTKLRWISTHQVVFIISFCLACPLWGQADKMNLVEKDFALWHSLTAPNISNNGTWTSYHKYYDTGADTLVLQNIHTKTQYFFPNGAREQFIGNNGFLLLDQKGLTHFNLITGIAINYAQVRDFKTSTDGSFIAALVNGANSEKPQSLLLVKRKGEVHITIPEVYEYTFDEDNQYLAFAKRNGTSYQLGYLDIQASNLAPKIIQSASHPFRRLVWGPNAALAFFEEMQGGKDKVVGWLPSIHHNEKFTFRTSDKQHFDYPIKVVNNLSTTLHFSKDGAKLLFHVQKLTQEINQDDHGSKVQVWNSKDILIYPVLEENRYFLENPPIMVAWDGKENMLYPMGNKDSSKAVWGTESEFVYTYSLLDDQSASDDPWEERPVMVYNTQTGESKFVVSRTAYMPIQASPSGRYLSYFNQTDWWVYDAVLDRHKNISHNIPSNFRNDEYDWSGIAPPYGMAGWTNNDGRLLLYDRYDIWEVSANGKEFEKLTHGHLDKVTYRVFTPKIVLDKFNGYRANSFNRNEGLLLKIEQNTTHKTGIVLLQTDGVLKKLVWGDFKASNIVADAHNNVIVYTQERFDAPPSIMAIYKENKKMELVFQSNPQHFVYKWGRSELINYKIQDGTELQGALFYPADYNPKNKYPMVTYIYEKMSNKLHQYTNPSFFNGADLNITNLTQRGYFVFCPDIVYKINEPGLSALRCVTAGVEKVLEMDQIDRKHLGLFGHSFGGYQTSFISTQSNLFATAISGAGYHDILSFYLSVAWLWNKPQAGRFLNDQQRFEKTYFESPELYKMNSPIEFAANIKIPLLTYTGNQDSNINWQQSVEMYNALRVLEKEHIMLIYPNEGHDLFSDEAQIDFTLKKWDWFDHYLKGAPKKSWMLEFK